MDQVHKHLHFPKILWLSFFAESFSMGIHFYWKLKALFEVSFLWFQSFVSSRIFFLLFFLLYIEVNIKLCLLLSSLFVCLFFKCLSGKLIWGVIFPVYILTNWIFWLADNVRIKWKKKRLKVKFRKFELKRLIENVKNSCHPTVIGYLLFLIQLLIIILQHVLLLFFRDYIPVNFGNIFSRIVDK